MSDELQKILDKCVEHWRLSSSDATLNQIHAWAYAAKIEQDKLEKELRTLKVFVPEVHYYT